MLPEVRMARVLDAIASHRAGRLSCVEAGELLGFSERHFRRLRDAFEERGEDGLVGRRRGRVSARAADEAEAAWVAEMFRTCSIPDVCIDERRLPLFIARATLRGLIAVLEARATGDAA